MAKRKVNNKSAAVVEGADALLDEVNSALENGQEVANGDACDDFDFDRVTESGQPVPLVGILRSCDIRDTEYGNRARFIIETDETDEEGEPVSYGKWMSKGWAKTAQPYVGHRVALVRYENKEGQTRYKFVPLGKSRGNRKSA